MTLIPKKELDAVMGFEGGEGCHWDEDPERKEYYGDDPMATLLEIQMKKAKISEKLWQEEDLKSEEIPGDIQDELKESGQVTVTLRAVRNSIGKDRQQWQLALESELQSLRDIGAIETVKHAPHGKQVLPMKVVLTLKPVPGISTKKARVLCLW